MISQLIIGQLVDKFRFFDHVAVQLSQQCSVLLQTICAGKQTDIVQAEDVKLNHGNLWLQM